LVKTVADRLRESVREIDFRFAIGGDEFYRFSKRK